jgi:hypothetical protein
VELVNRSITQGTTNTMVPWLLIDGLGMSVQTRSQIRYGDELPYTIGFNVKDVKGVSLHFGVEQIDLWPYARPANPNDHVVPLGGRFSSCLPAGCRSGHHCLPQAGEDSPA